MFPPTGIQLFSPALVHLYLSGNTESSLWARECIDIMSTSTFSSTIKSLSYFFQPSCPINTMLFVLSCPFTTTKLRTAACDEYWSVFQRAHSPMMILQPSSDIAEVGLSDEAFQPMVVGPATRLPWTQQAAGDSWVALRAAVSTRTAAAGFDRGIDVCNSNV